MQRLWTIKTWSSILIIVVMGLGLTALTAIQRLYQQAMQYAGDIAVAVESGAKQLPFDPAHALELEARIWAGVVVLWTTLGAVLCLLFRQRLERYLLAPLRRLAGYFDRVARGERFLRLPPQKETALNQLITSGNVLIQRFNKYVEESQRTGAAARQHAQALINTSSDIALLINEAGEPVMTNRAAQQFSGNLQIPNLAECLSEVREGGSKELQFGGKTLNVLDVINAATKGFDGTLILLREAAPDQAESDQ